MDVTKGRGVDIVLNSLTGRFITQSLKCLAPFGRFVEIGKADIYRNSKLNLERLGENISYFVVDVDRLAVQKPELHRQVFWKSSPCSSAASCSRWKSPSSRSRNFPRP